MNLMGDVLCFERTSNSVTTVDETALEMTFLC